MNNSVSSDRPRFHRVVIRTADLDTVMCAFLLGLSPALPLEVVGGLTPAFRLADPSTCCIECGGSGQVELGNFDHHDPLRHDPPASLQALGLMAAPDPLLIRLARWTAARDMTTGTRSGGYPDLSNLFSGLRLVSRDEAQAFAAGLELLRTIHVLGCRPEGPLPWRPEWRTFLEAKARNRQQLRRDLGRKIEFTTKSGIRAGFLETMACGVHGILRSQGCRLTIACRRSAGAGGRWRYSVATDLFRLDSLRCRLNLLEPGWGGPAHGTIVGSPFGGSRIDPALLRGIVCSVV